MIRLELGGQAPLSQFFLQVAVKLERVVLGHHDAYLVVIRGKIAQNTLSHALEATQDEAVWNNDVGDKRFKPATDIKVCKFELNTTSCQIDGSQASLRVATVANCVMARWAIRLSRLDNHPRRRILACHFGG